MERVTQVGLLDWRAKRTYYRDFRYRLRTVFRGRSGRRLTFIYEYDFHDCVERDIDLVCAHAVSAAVGGFVVAVTERLGRDVLQLGQRWRARERERDLVDQTYDVVTATRSDCAIKKKSYSFSFQQGRYNNNFKRGIKNCLSICCTDGAGRVLRVCRTRI
jgi:hypothetical protein